jgi:flavin-dependent dehydrogenase
VDFLVAPRRYILDSLVAEAAVKAGAILRQGVTVTGVRSDRSGRATGVDGHESNGEALTIGARFVVGADGMRSRVARSVGAEIIEDRGDDGAVQYAYYGGIPWRGVELIAGDGALTGVFPTHHGEACIWICSPSADARKARRGAASRAEAFTAYLDSTAPDLARRLRAGQRTSVVAGMLRTPNYVRRAHGRGWALVGDAGYHRDAVTGHGLSDAYRDAELLAVALDQTLRGDADETTALAGYQRERDRALRDIFDLTCALASYPPVTEFVELQRRLSVAIDIEAADVATGPLPTLLAQPATAALPSTLAEPANAANPADREFAA